MNTPRNHLHFAPKDTIPPVNSKSLRKLVDLACYSFLGLLCCASFAHTTYFLLKYLFTP